MTAQPHSALSAARLIEAPPATRPDPELPGFEHRFATVDGVRLHYVTGGKADGEVVVLLAGFPESWFAWRKVMPLLALGFRIIAPDLPGQGDSDRPQSGYDTQTLAVQMHGLLQQLGVTAAAWPPTTSAPGSPTPTRRCSAARCGAWS